MIALALAAMMATAPLDPGLPALPQTAQATAAIADDTPVRLEDIEVTGRSRDSLIRSFVSEVAAPNFNRGLARWEDAICVGTANLRAEPAQYVVDRVSAVAQEVGLRPGQPGCAPNVIIIATEDPSGVAALLTRDRERAFRPGGSGMDRGGAALHRFVASQAPVRWWQVSMPTNSDTGLGATRIAGDCRNACTTPEDLAPLVFVMPSRLSTPIVDNIFRTVVILDVDQVNRISGRQLADYVAMITLAQIDPEADTSRYASILNVFDAPDTAPGLTDWDKAYLEGLYEAQRTRRNLRAGRDEIARSIWRAHERLQSAGLGD